MASNRFLDHLLLNRNRMIVITRFKFLLSSLLIFSFFLPKICIFSYVFKIPCPLCGTSRAFIEILRLNFLEALLHNAMIYPLLIAGIWIGIGLIRSKEVRIPINWSMNTIILGYVILNWLIKLFLVPRGYW